MTDTSIGQAESRARQDFIDDEQKKIQEVEARAYNIDIDNRKKYGKSKSSWKPFDKRYDNRRKRGK